LVKLQAPINIYFSTVVDIVNSIVDIVPVVDIAVNIVNPLDKKWDMNRLSLVEEVHTNSSEDIDTVDNTDSVRCPVDSQ
jgi:hypothetical protein